jgi:hypothetical protein
MIVSLKSSCRTVHAIQMRSIARDPIGQWLVTGRGDGTVRLSDDVPGYCSRVWDLVAKVHCIA